MVAESTHPSVVANAQVLVTDTVHACGIAVSSELAPLAAPAKWASAVVNTSAVSSVLAWLFAAHCSKFVR